MSDFSCYVTVRNASPIPNTVLVLQKADAVHGSWAVNPPQQILMGQNASFRIQDPAGAAVGAQGWVMYAISIEGQIMGSIVFSFEDPYNGDNSVSWNWSPAPVSGLVVSFTAYSNGNPPLDNGIQPDGHPVYVTYTIT